MEWQEDTRGLIPMAIYKKTVTSSHCSLVKPWDDKYSISYPDRKVHGANMGPTWVLSAPCWPHELSYMGSTIACCLRAPIRFMNQYEPMLRLCGTHLRASAHVIIGCNEFKNCRIKIIVPSPRDQWIISIGFFNVRLRMCCICCVYRSDGV